MIVSGLVCLLVAFYQNKFGLAIDTTSYTFSTFLDAFN